MYYLDACPKLCPTQGGAHRLLRVEELQLDRLGLGQGGEELAAEDRRVAAGVVVRAVGLQVQHPNLTINNNLHCFRFLELLLTTFSPVGSRPTVRQVMTMKIPGRKKTKMSRIGLRFIVIQFLIKRARMFLVEGRTIFLVFDFLLSSPARSKSSSRG